MPEPATNATIYPFLVRADRSRSKYAHDNPQWAVSSRRNAAIAATLHRACDFTDCSTLVAATIVGRDDFAYFRDRPRQTNSR
ncbi:hypothetical protein IU479_02135 [Nocardia abscessus]|uniref:hypothetical protein n=1 Tax=Nocardia TaxID=1817 RepID=UPI0018954A40|nr:MULTISPECIES: hypothetical protein [Nocardia]MBF6216908.1 hypothetical protein [Nocardia abscessus]MDE1672729.1 hypothetical protein [Nocardia gipuzkoensis]